MRIEQHNLDTLRELIRNLQQENEDLKALLDAHQIPYVEKKELDESSESDDYDEDQGARILPFFPTEKMANEFFSYFWGRQDVYALRGRNGGYFPQCSGWFDNPLCPKKSNPKLICDEDCPHKAWRPLELWMIQYHLRGKKADCTDVLGIYPLLPDNTCRFLVFDFDNHEKDSYKTDDANTDDLWKSEVNALRRICEMNHIDALTERSRSGKGAHIWIFFKGPVQASLARAFGYALLDRGASSINLPSFKYYDRMYPSQDVLSKLGNLIALPLQGRALKQGNSAFIDKSWNAYPDQWQTLKSVRKLSASELADILQKWSSDVDNDQTRTKYAQANLSTRPWKKDSIFHCEDVIGGTLHIVLDNGIYVDTLL